MKLAFTLLEVIIASIIITFMSIGILQLQSNTTHSLDILGKQRHMAIISSTMLSQPDESLHNKSRTLYEFLKDRYNIAYYPLRKELKKLKFTFREERAGYIQLKSPSKTPSSKKFTNINKKLNIRLFLNIYELKTKSQFARVLTFGLNP